jgi:hypothetical protein
VVADLGDPLVSLGRQEFDHMARELKADSHG